MVTLIQLDMRNAMHIILGEDGIVEVSAEEVVDVGWCLSVRMLVYFFLASVEHRK